MHTTLEHKVRPLPAEKHSYQAFREVELLRHLYGLFYMLSSRPISAGNTIALEEGLRDVEQTVALLREHHGSLLATANLDTIQHMLELNRSLPKRLMASTLIRSVHRLLVEGQAKGASSWTTLYHHPILSDPRAVEELVVAVGPTIGLGDEVIAARALVTFARVCGFGLAVSTRRFDLWRFLDDHIKALPQPPLGHLEYLETREAGERTAYLFLDFLPSDPSPVPRFRPPGLLFSGRWIFGEASCLIAREQDRKVYKRKYPESHPRNRHLEAQWVLSEIFPLTEAQLDALPGEAVRASPGQRLSRPKTTVLLQTLTSKPKLIFPPWLYREMFRAVRERATEDFRVAVITGPSDRSEQMTDRIYHTLEEGVPGCEIVKLPRLSLGKLIREFGHGGLLFGPDTFTGHVAAIFGIPQLTIHLAQHRAWLNPATPSCYVESHRLGSGAAPEVQEALAWMIDLHQAPPSRTHACTRLAADWCTAMMGLRRLVLRFLTYSTSGAGHTEPFEQGAAELVGLGRRARDAFAHELPRLAWRDLEMLEHCRWEDYPNATDKWIAQANWFHDVGASNLSGMLHMIHRPPR